MQLRKQFDFPKSAFKSFREIERRFRNDKVFVIDLPTYGKSIVVFDHNGTEIPGEVLEEVANGAYICCSFPEKLPNWLRKRHIFPNGKGVCNFFLSEPSDGKAFIRLEMARG